MASINNSNLDEDPTFEGNNVDRRNVAVKEKLIELVRAQPFLYDKSDSNYSKRFIRDQFFVLAAAQLSTEDRPFTRIEIAKMWKGLQDTFRECHNKWKKLTPPGTSAEMARLLRPKWRYYNSLQFLLQPVKTKSHLQATVNPEDYCATSSFDQSGSAASPPLKRIKQFPSEEVNEEGQNPSEEFAEIDPFAHDQIMCEPANAYCTMQEGFTVEHYNNNKDASPKMCLDTSTSNNDILATLLRNQQLMLDAVNRLEIKLDSVQHDFNMRLTTIEKYTNLMTRQVQKSFNTIEARLDSFIAAYSNPAPISDSKDINENALCTTTIGNSWDQISAVTNVTTDLGAAHMNSLPLAAENPVLYRTKELQQQLDIFSCLTNTPGNSYDKNVPDRRGNQRSGAKLALDPSNPTIGWIGGSPNLSIPVSEYSEIWSKFGATPLQLLRALLSHVYGGSENLKHWSWSGIDGHPCLKDDPRFASCVKQVSLQFPTFQMNTTVEIKVADWLSNLSKQHMFPTSMIFENASCYNLTECSDEDAFSFSGLPSAGNVDANIAVVVKSEVIDD